MFSLDILNSQWRIDGIFGLMLKPKGGIMTCLSGGMEVSRNVHRILVRGVNAPLPPEVKKI